MIAASVVVALTWSAPTLAGGPAIIDREEYESRVRAMWLAQAIANWTGLTTEGGWQEPPFLTDADWGTTQGGALIDFVLDQDPWLSDDDTDIEYVYQHLLEQEGLRPTGEEIAVAWIAHVNTFIWVSNKKARLLMDRGMVPPETGHGTANIEWNKIDAQLTTEFFGAIAPGMPALALDLADLPIRNVAWSHAAHAAQYHVVLYSLAPFVDRTLTPRDQAVWLVTEARKWIPDGSKTADAVDLVLADFLANPDVNDWERTRDLIYTEFQLNAGINGYHYRGWFEDIVNFAAGVMALLYGEMDVPRTIQIGTLSGWDSDNPTATMAGLLGLVLGHDDLIAQLPPGTYSDRYRIHRTRPTMPDLLPGDPDAEDTFTMMASRLAELVDQAVIEGGGAVSDDAWLIPPMPVDVGGSLHHLNPLTELRRRSANNQVRDQGGTVTGWRTGTPSVPSTDLGWPQARWMVNGFAMDFDGTDVANGVPRSSTTFGVTLAPEEEITLRVTYSQPVEASSVLFVEGDHFPRPNTADPWHGGWFETVRVELLIDGVWQPAAATPSKAMSPSIPYEFIEFRLDATVIVTGAQLVGLPGGTDRFVTAGELDVLAEPMSLVVSPYDINADGRLTIDDLHAITQHPADINGDGLANADDAALVEQALRFNEQADMRGGR